MANIFLIDSDVDVLRQFEELIIALGHTPILATKTSSVLKIMGIHQIDLVLTDVFMPEMGGIAVLQQLKGHPVYKDIPVIMITGEQNEDLLSKCFAAGAMDFIFKTANVSAFHARIQSALVIYDAFKKQKTHTYQLQTELHLAAEIQHTMMRFPHSSSFLKSAKLFRPHEEVSGDIYDVISNDERVGVFLGDVTGHGVSAALVTMMVKTALSTIEREMPTNELMGQLNRLLFNCIPESMFASGIYMRITSDGKLSVTIAGHPPIIIIPADRKEPVLIHKTGTLLGIFEEPKNSFKEETYQLESGDKIFLYTDGIMDCLKQVNESGIPHLISFLETNKSFELDTILAGLLEYLTKSTKDTKFLDDMTVLGFQFQ